MLSPASTTSTVAASAGPNDLRPGSSMAQPLTVLPGQPGSSSSYGGSNGPAALAAPNGMHHVNAHSHGAAYPAGASSSYLLGPRIVSNGGVLPSGRANLPAPLNVPSLHRNLNGPLSHSSPRVVGANAVGADYYWGS